MKETILKSIFLALLLIGIKTEQLHAQKGSKIGNIM